MSRVQNPRPITIEETQVARYHAFEETASGFTLPSSESTDFSFDFALPGAIALPAVIYYRTRHIGTPHFNVRINDATVTEYIFVDSDEAERTWHEVIPANTPGGPTLRPDNNELVFFASGAGTGSSEDHVVFGDVVIVYTSNQTTVSVPIIVTTQQ
jgi:hypothetical protein